MGHLVNWEVFANSYLRRPPQKGAVSGVQFDQQGAVTEQRAVGGAVWDRLV